MQTTPMRLGKSPVLFWLLVCGAAAGLFTIASVAWQAASQQRRDGEAAMRESARLTAQRTLDAMPNQFRGPVLFSGSSTYAGSQLLEVHYPNPAYQFGIAFSTQWFRTPGAAGDWLFGPWPQLESDLSEELAAVQQLLAANKRKEAAEKYQNGPLAIYPGRKTADGRVLVMVTSSTAAEVQTTSSGLPLAPLVARLRLSLAESESERRTAARNLLWEALAHPSPITEALLEEATQALPNPNADEAKELESAQHHAAELIAFRQTARNHQAEILRGERWLEHQWHLIYESDGRVTVETRDQAREFARRAGLLAESPQGLPVGWRFRPWLDGELLADAALGSEPVLTAATNGSWNLEVICNAGAKPFATLDAQLFRQRWLIGGAAAALALAGAGIAYSFASQRRLNSVMSNFVAAVSHELRAPVGSMGLLAERLGDNNVVAAEDAAHYPRLIRDECRRLSATIENVFAFSRIKRGRTAFDPELSDVTALLRDSAELVTPLAEQKGVTVQLEIPDTVVEAEIDPISLRQALLNLLDNALKFSPPGGTVALSLTTEDEMLAISVSDDGPGIPPGERERIFRPFYRTGSELRREHPGIGIGLAIVKHVAEQHGGSVRVDSKGHGGSRFTVHLPRQSIRDA